MARMKRITIIVSKNQVVIFDDDDNDDDDDEAGCCVKTPTAPDFDLRMASIRPDQPYTSPKNIQCQKSSLLPSTVSMISPTGIYESKN